MNSSDVLIKIVVTFRRFLDCRNLCDDPKSSLAIKPNPTWPNYDEIKTSWLKSAQPISIDHMGWFYFFGLFLIGLLFGPQPIYNHFSIFFNFLYHYNLGPGLLVPKYIWSSFSFWLLNFSFVCRSHLSCSSHNLSHMSRSSGQVFISHIFKSHTL